jgi:hypothetical protein
VGVFDASAAPIVGDHGRAERSDADIRTTLRRVLALWKEAQSGLPRMIDVAARRVAARVLASGPIPAWPDGFGTVC